jgi:hypothetical protein
VATISVYQAAQNHPSQDPQQAFRLNEAPLRRDHAAVDPRRTPAAGVARPRRFAMELTAANVTPIAVLFAAEAVIVSVLLLTL